LLDAEERVNTNVWHIHNCGQEVPEYGASIDYSTVNNLLDALATDSPALVLEYLEGYDPDVADYPEVVRDLVGKALNYHRDFILPSKKYHVPDAQERAMLLDLRDRLAAYEGHNVDEIQAMPFDVAKAHDVSPRTFFRLFYEVVLGQDRGPRFGAFTLLIGKARMVELIEGRCQAED
jgi:lysyl-tRNA synthetase class 1